MVAEVIGVLLLAMAMSAGEGSNVDDYDMCDDDETLGEVLGGHPDEQEEAEADVANVSRDGSERPGPLAFPGAHT